jgi:purine nucleoside permease
MCCEYETSYKAAVSDTTKKLAYRYLEHPHMDKRFFPICLCRASTGTRYWRASIKAVLKQGVGKLVAARIAAGGTLLFETSQVAEQARRDDGA